MGETYYIDPMEYCVMLENHILLQQEQINDLRNQINILYNSIQMGMSDNIQVVSSSEQGVGKLSDLVCVATKLNDAYAENLLVLGPVGIGSDSYAKACDATGRSGKIGMVRGQAGYFVSCVDSYSS